MFLIKIIVFLLGLMMTSVYAEGELIWSRAIGGQGTDMGYGITVDAQDQIYTTGSFSGTVDFDPAETTATLSSDGFSDIFIAQFSPQGELVWAQSIGNNQRSSGRDIALDSQGNVYVTGSFSGQVDFDPGIGVQTLSSSGTLDSFVLKLDAQGQLLWAQALGGEGEEVNYGIAIDNNDNVYGVGFSSSGGPGVLVAQWNSSGELIWQRHFPSDQEAWGFDIALDPTGLIYITGAFHDRINFAPSSSSFALTSVGADDIFVAQLTPQGQANWVKQFGGTSGDRANSITVDNQGNSYLTGGFESPQLADPTQTNLTINNAGGTDVFIAKLNNLGQLEWLKQLGASEDDQGHHIVVGPQGQLYLTGFFSQAIELTLPSGLTTVKSIGLWDIFVGKLTPQGQWLWFKHMGGVKDSYGEGENLFVDSQDNLYLTGSFTGNLDFDPGVGTQELSSQGEADIYLTRLGSVAEIKVVTATTEIIDGSTVAVAFPNTVVGQPVTQSFTVHNQGSVALNLAQLSLPPGFSLVDTFPSSIVPQASAQFTLQFNAESLGVFNGRVQFATNDPDENPFDFAVIAQVNAGLSTVQFVASDYRLAETQAQATLLVSRAGSDVGAVSVAYTTQAVSATAGTDYTTTSGTLSWANGDSTHKMIQVPIVTDNIQETEESFQVLLSQITGNAELGPQRQATVTLSDAGFEPGAGQIQFATQNYTVRETSGPAVIAVDRVAGSQGAVAVNYRTLEDSATANSDYTPAAGSLNWPDNNTQRQLIQIPLLADNVTESAEQLRVELYEPSGGAALGNVHTVTLTLVDSLGHIDTSTLPGSLQFSQDNYEVAKESTEATVSVVRTDGSQGIVSVDYHTEDRSAQAGQAYQSQTGQLTWNSGADQPQDITIPLLGEPIVGQQFAVNLAQPTGGAQLGAIATTTLTIVDTVSTPSTLSSPSGVLEFGGAHYQVNESSGTIMITILRTGGSQGVIEVSYSTQDGSATTGQDYIATQGQFRWLDSDATPRSFEIGIYDDGIMETEEHFKLLLSQPTGGALLGPNAQSSVTINDDDGISLQFSSTTYAVDEHESEVVITVTRQSNNLASASVHYQTADITATAGEDYVTTQGRLNWVSGDLSDKTFTIPLQDDRDVEGNERIQLTLADVSDNARLGEPSTATVVIVENDSGDCAPTTVIDCFFNNEGQTLTDIAITEFGTVSGGQLGGNIQNDGVIQDLTLLPDTQVSGRFHRGIARGQITGDPQQPAVLSDVDITADAVLTHVIIGRGSRVDSQVTFQEGVCFEENISVPSVTDLVPLLGVIKTPDLALNAVHLTTDVLCDSEVNGIVSAINGLLELRRLNLTVYQNPVTGYLELDAGDQHYAVLPVAVRQILRHQVDQFIPLGINTAPDGQMTFITYTSREVTAYPVIQAPLALRKALLEFGLDHLVMLNNGNLKVSASQSPIYYSARPEQFALKTQMPLTFDGVPSPWVENTAMVFFVFAAGEQNLLQYFYPAAADPEALAQARLELDGRVFVQLGSEANKRTYRGFLDYRVTPGAAVSDAVQFLDIEDVNGDGLSDYRIVYPNGDNQIMFQLPPQITP